MRMSLDWYIYLVKSAVLKNKCSVAAVICFSIIWIWWGMLTSGSSFLYLFIFITTWEFVKLFPVKPDKTLFIIPLSEKERTEMIKNNIKVKMTGLFLYFFLFHLLILCITLNPWNLVTFPYLVIYIPLMCMGEKNLSLRLTNAKALLYLWEVILSLLFLGEYTLDLKRESIAIRQVIVFYLVAIIVNIIHLKMNAKEFKEKVYEGIEKEVNDENSDTAPGHNSYL